MRGSAIDGLNLTDRKRLSESTIHRGKRQFAIMDRLLQDAVHSHKDQIREMDNDELFQLLEKHAVTVRSISELCTNEEQTKTSLINPYIELLGYDVRNPREVRLEYSTDIGIGGEKVDYALMKGDDPVLLIEAKSATFSLPEEPPRQLRRYAMSKNSVQQCALTNGIKWQWYAKESNSSDLQISPFLVHDTSDPKRDELRWLSSLKDDPSVWNDIATLEALKSNITRWFDRQRTNPDDALVTTIIRGLDGYRNSRGLKEQVRSLYPQIVRNFIDAEINRALQRAKIDPSNEEESRSNEVVPSGLEAVEADSDEETFTTFETATGSVSLDPQGIRRAWRRRNNEHWTVRSSMRDVCVDILKEMASMSDGSTEDFYRRLAALPDMKKFISTDSREDVPRTEIEDGFFYLYSYSNSEKVRGIEKAATQCLKNGVAINFHAEFDVWNPVRRLNAIQESEDVSEP